MVQSKQYGNMDFNEFSAAMDSNELTTFQKKCLYIDKYFKWKGKVKDVFDYRIELKLIDSYNLDKNLTLILKDDQKPKLSSIKIGSCILFEGLARDDSLYIQFDDSISYEKSNSIKLYSGTIIK